MLVNAITHGSHGATALRAGITTLLSRIEAAGTGSGASVANALHREVVLPLLHTAGSHRAHGFTYAALGTLDDAVLALRGSAMHVARGTEAATATTRGVELLEQASRQLRFLR